MEKNIFAQKMKCKAEKEKEGIFREDFFGGKRRKRRRKRRKIFGEGKSVDRQLDKQTEFPFVDSTPSVKGSSKNTEFIQDSFSSHR